MSQHLCEYKNLSLRVKQEVQIKLFPNLERSQFFSNELKRK